MSNSPSLIDTHPPISAFLPGSLTRSSPSLPFTPSAHSRHPAVLSTENTLTNIDMGDSLQEILNPNSLSPPALPPSFHSQTIRLYFQNVNGLRLQDNASDIIDSLLHMQAANVDIFGFVETKLHCRDHRVQSILHSCRRKVFDTCKLFSCSSDEEWPTLHKPGGTLLGITNNLVGRAKRHFSDKFGRWIRVDLLGRDGRTISIICAYQVVQFHQAGDKTAFSQQLRLLRLEGIDQPCPRQQFIRDLTSLVESLTKQNHDIILMGDFNEVIGEDPNEMARVMKQGKLTDAYCHKHGLTNESSTYARGNRRVDYILVSPRLVEFIRHTGAEPFNFRIFSDHRGLFVDFSMPGFFDRAPNTLAKLQTRHLIYDCPRHIKLYLSKTADYFRQHNIPSRVKLLLNGDRDDQAAEALDRDITQAMLYGEAACKSAIRYPWSKALHLAMNKLYILKRVLSQYHTHFDMTASIHAMQMTLPNPIPIPTTLKDINHDLRAARRDVRQIARDGYKRRKEYAQEKILALQLANPKKSPASIEKSFINAQASKELYRKVPSARPASSGGISMIKIPIDPSADPKHPDTTFQSIVDPLEVENHILRRNRIHFGQAKDTPLASPSITSALGFGGTTSIADMLLAGTADINSITTNKFGQALLRKCKRFHPEMSPDISLDEFKASYAKWKVGTSTSPSGRHLSHQHALLQPHGIHPDTDPEGYAAAEDSRLDNWMAQHGMISYATKHGYCFDRWTHVINAMIEKEPGNPQLHRLRVIHLYESDYNSLLGIKLRQTIHHCEDKRTFNTGTYGSRSNRQSLDPVFLEVLQYDYASLTRWPEIKFSNDATSCYDRIIPSVSNILARAMGLHHNIADIHGSMLSKAIYRIKTQLGVSSGSYSHSDEYPIFGTGQGSCASPLIWLMNCSALFDIYDSLCHGSSYYNLQGDIVLKVGMTGFVDDNSCNVNCRPHEIDSLASSAAHDAQLWSDILWSSGGALEHSKCSYHFLKTTFTIAGAPVFEQGQFGHPITITDHQGTVTTIDHRTVYSAYKTLGTQQCATSNQPTQFATLLKKASQLSRALALSACSAPAAWLFYTSVFSKSIGYPLAVSRLSEKNLHTLEGPMLSLTLNRMRYPRRLARALVHGPRSHGGLAFPSLKTIQGSSKIKLLIRHLRTPGQPRFLSLIVLDRLQHMSGIGIPILEYPSIHLPHLEGIWLPSARQYLSEIDGSLTISNLTIQPLQRHGDRYIMELALESQAFSDVEIRQINYCRLFFQALTLSDICNARGTSLALGIYKGEPSWHQSRSLLQEPYQANPNSRTWSIWRRFLRMLCPNKQDLPIPLGIWYAGLSKRRRWPAYFSPSMNYLYTYDGEVYHSHTRLSWDTFSFSIFQENDDLPYDATPIDVVDLDDVWLGFNSDCDLFPSEESPILSFTEYIQTLPDHERFLLQHHSLFHPTPFDICDIIYSLNDIILVSDGGAIPGSGSFGWVLSTTDGTRLANGYGPAFGLDPRSYRSECYGAKAGFLFLIMIYRYCGRPLPEGSFEYYCDNEGLIKKLHYLHNHPNAIYESCLHSDWDVFSAVHRLSQLFPDLPSINHIKGHQDRYSETLDLAAQLNVEADALATSAMAHLGRPYPLVPFDPSNGVMFHIRGATITRRFDQAVHSAVHLPPLCSHYCNKFKWTQDTFYSIDWDSFSSVYTKYTRTRTFFHKFGWKQLPVGSLLHEWRFCHDHRCPSCSSDLEDDDHLFQCEHHARASWRSSLFRQILNRFESFLDPTLLVIIRIGLTSYFTDCHPDFHLHFPEGYSTTPYAQLIDQQSQIGWGHFLRGKLSYEWGTLQHIHASRYNLHSESKGWIPTLIRLFASESFRLWELRNGCRHGTDASSRAFASAELAKRQLTALYSLKEQMLPQDRIIFRSSLATHLTETTQQIRSWITHNTKLISTSVKRAISQAKLGTQGLQRYFPRIRSNPRPKPPTPIQPISHHDRRRMRSSRIFEHFRSARTSTSRLPKLPELGPLIPRHPPVSRSRQCTLAQCFPDHPG